VETERTTQEISRLRRCINDLASILALPAMWAGHDSSRVTTTLLDIMVGLLDLDFAYARTADPANESPHEWIRSADTNNYYAEAHEVGRALEPYLSDETPRQTLRIANPVAEGTASIAVFHLGVQNRFGVFVAASRRSEFPTETERLLLQVATNQAAIALQEARRIAERDASVEIERARTKAALQDSEERFRQMADSIPEMIRLIIDLTPAHIHTALPDGYIDFFNQTWLQYMGVPLENVQGWKWTAVIHPADVEGIVERWRASLASGEPFLYEARVRRADGKYRWMLHHKIALRVEHGKIVRWYGTSIDIEDRKLAEEEIKRLKDRLQRENVALREEIDKASMFEEIVGSSPALQEVLSRVAKVAPTDSTVLLTGETGTGKELVARAIHKRSQRSSHAFVSVNCAAIPQSLIGSELFGHEKGSFTGALQRRLGRFELAEGGTIFLDEIGELPSETKNALLRVLQEREFERVGGTQTIRADVRVIAATNRDLKAAIAAGTFRSDLFYRLAVFPIEIPPLRERREDILMLVEYFIDRYAKKVGKKIHGVNKKTLELLQSYPWPGNIRELQNVIERSVIICETENFSVDESWLTRESLSARPASQRFFKMPVAQEKEMIEAALADTEGQVSGPSGAAAKLGIPPSTLDSKIKSLKINKNRFKIA
jgi:PAS domain S-box-containing protein